MPATQVLFTPAASVLIQVPHLPTKADLPPPDPDNLAVVLHNHGPGLVAVKAGDAGAPGFHAPGSTTLHAGQVVMLPNDPGLAQSDAVMVHSMPGIPATPDGMVHPLAGTPTKLTITRGRLTEMWLFTAPSAEVI